MLDPICFGLILPYYNSDAKSKINYSWIYCSISFEKAIKTIKLGEELLVGSSKFIYKKKHESENRLLYQPWTKLLKIKHFIGHIRKCATLDKDHKYLHLIKKKKLSQKPEICLVRTHEIEKMY